MQFISNPATPTPSEFLFFQCLAKNGGCCQSFPNWKVYGKGCVTIYGKANRSSGRLRLNL
ncbi:MAG: hypothetical protein P1V97_10150 [Planctomycetota bacterium]|nr:hypothetical protein [Planctomycetota bacterium]